MLAVAMDGQGLSDRVAQKLQPFSETMAAFIALCETMPLSAFTEQMIGALEYEAFLRAEDKKGDLENRMDNLRELIGNIREVERDVPEGESALPDVYKRQKLCLAGGCLPNAVWRKRRL